MIKYYVINMIFFKIDLLKYNKDKNRINIIVNGIIERTTNCI